MWTRVDIVESVNTNIILGFVAANLDSKIGAVGSLPNFIPQKFFPVAIIRMDDQNEEPIRDENGLCIRCDAGKYLA
jgi:hypothetical protein